MIKYQIHQKTNIKKKKSKTNKKTKKKSKTNKKTKKKSKSLKNNKKGKKRHQKTKKLTRGGSDLTTKQEEGFVPYHFQEYLSGPTQLILMQKNDRVTILIGDAHFRGNYCKGRNKESSETIFSFLKKVIDIYKTNNKTVNILLEDIDSKTNFAFQESNIPSLTPESSFIYDYDDGGHFLEEITSFLKNIDKTKYSKYVKYIPLEFRRQTLDNLYPTQTPDSIRDQIHTLVQDNHPILNNYYEQYTQEIQDPTSPQEILARIYGIMLIHLFDNKTLKYINNTNPKYKYTIVITGSQHTMNIYEQLKIQGWNIKFEVGNLKPIVSSLTSDWSYLTLSQCLNIHDFVNTLQESLKIEVLPPPSLLQSIKPGDHF